MPDAANVLTEIIDHFAESERYLLALEQTEFWLTCPPHIAAKYSETPKNPRDLYDEIEAQFEDYHNQPVD